MYIYVCIYIYIYIEREREREREIHAISFSKPNNIDIIYVSTSIFKKK